MNEAKMILIISWFGLGFISGLVSQYLEYLERNKTDFWKEFFLNMFVGTICGWLSFLIMIVESIKEFTNWKAKKAFENNLELNVITKVPVNVNLKLEFKPIYFHETKKNGVLLIYNAEQYPTDIYQCIKDRYFYILCEGVGFDSKMIYKMNLDLTKVEDFLIELHQIKKKTGSFYNAFKFLIL